MMQTDRDGWTQEEEGVGLVMEMPHQSGGKKSVNVLLRQAPMLHIQYEGMTDVKLKRLNIMECL